MKMIDEATVSFIRWHNINSEEKPVVGEHYLVMDNTGQSAEAIYYPPHKGEEIWVDPIEEYFQFKGVTHWAKMPKPFFNYTNEE